MTTKATEPDEMRDAHPEQHSVAAEPRAGDVTPPLDAAVANLTPRDETSALENRHELKASTEASEPKAPRSQRPSRGFKPWVGERWSSFRDKRAWWVDRIWPSLRPLSPAKKSAIAAKDEAREKEAVSLLDSALAREPTAKGAVGDELRERADAAADGAKTLLDAERDKRKSVEGRLTTILGFVALASTIAISVMGLRLSDDVYRNHPYVSTLSIVLMGYMVLQLVRAGVAAVVGLGRTSYLEPTHRTFLETLKPVDRQKQLAKAYLECTFDHERMNRAKVDQLALAHEATKNFLGALACLMVVALLGALLHIWSTNVPPRSMGRNPETASTELNEPNARPSESPSEPTSNAVREAATPADAGPTTTPRVLPSVPPGVSDNDLAPEAFPDAQ